MPPSRFLLPRPSLFEQAADAPRPELPGIRYAKPRAVPDVRYISYDSKTKKEKDKQMAGLKRCADDEREAEYEFEVRLFVCSLLCSLLLAQQDSVEGHIASSTNDVRNPSGSHQ
jgi:hypothetical protein